MRTERNESKANGKRAIVAGKNMIRFFLFAVVVVFVVVACSFDASVSRMP